MARGKHRAAAQRRYDQHAEQRILDLERELRDTKDALQVALNKAARVDALDAANRQLREERDEAVSPELRGLQKMYADLQEELRKARAETKGIGEKWDKLIDRVIARFGEGKTRVENLEWLGEMLGMPMTLGHDTATVGPGGRDPVKTRIIQRS